MLLTQALAFYDEGMALPHVLDRLLVSSEDHRLEVATCLVKSALEMPDLGVLHIQTPVKREIRPGCIEVGDTVIAIEGATHAELTDTRHSLILLTFGEPAPSSSAKAPTTYTADRLSRFVAQIVTLRACCSKGVVRKWLESINLA